MEPTQNRVELYRTFNRLVSQDAQKERSAFNRRMLGVFLWCFLVPAVLCILLLFLVRLGVLPREARIYTGLVVLLVPVGYAAYFLVTEAFRELPKIFRRGSGMSISAGQFVRDSEWRERFCDQLRRELPFRTEDWRWLLLSFQADLETLRARTRYITGLAGAVFFLIMQGIDSIGDGATPSHLAANSLGWFDWDLSQFAGLTLFLLLLYLSGSQAYQTLKRYQTCAELVLLDAARAERIEQSCTAVPGLP